MKRWKKLLLGQIEGFYVTEELENTPT